MRNDPALRTMDQLDQGEGEEEMLED